MKVELLGITKNAEELIEEAGRTCYKSTPGKKEIIQKWIKMGHESMLEHASATFRISGISRACSHQLVRHRIASYSQQSQRYVKENKFEGIIPNSIMDNKKAFELYKNIMELFGETYNKLIEMGVKPEDARMLLPNACCTEIVVTMNFRAYRNFFKLRLDEHAQWEIREMAEKMIQILYNKAPYVFEDIVFNYVPIMFQI